MSALSAPVWFNFDLDHTLMVLVREVAERAERPTHRFSPSFIEGIIQTVLVVYCADVGSIKRGNFGWARLPDESEILTGGDISQLAHHVSDDLDDGRRVALGFECPLWIPIPDDPKLLLAARDGEGSRPWSAGAGCGSLVAGLAESAWILREVVRRHPNLKVTTDLEAFRGGEHQLLLWEAFVSAHRKPAESTHEADALHGAEAFLNAFEKREASTVTTNAESVVSLIGVVARWAGCRIEEAELRRGTSVF